MLPTAPRLLRLLSLLQARRFWSGADLAERLEVTARTLRRDIDRLRALGYPVHGAAGVAGGYQLGAGAALPPLQLDDDEALAVSIALGTAATSNVHGIDEADLRALVKLEQVLPPHVRRRSDALRATLVLHRPAADVSASLLARGAGGGRDHVGVGCGFAVGGGNTRQRRVEPVGLVHASARWYLVAWDTDRDDFRTFRVDRFTSTPELGARFAPRPPPEGGDLRRYVSRALSTAPYEARASVIVHTPLEAMQRRVSAAEGLLEPIDAERCRLRAGASTPAHILAWLLMLGVDFEVEEPAELIEHVRLMRARLGRVLSAARTPARRRAAAQPSPAGRVRADAAPPAATRRASSTARRPRRR